MTVMFRTLPPGIFPGGKVGRCVGLTTLPHSCADYLEIWETQHSWKPQGLSRPVMGFLYLLPLRVCDPAFRNKRKLPTVSPGSTVTK